ncbi:type II secretion system F family protein [Allobranchiibius sp. GilTou73]|uniref:type II secretion system F family protein n=1 Tax=Allobranchiibius sp. GilTou73 TaxID=2904523 RepID=UPI001F1F2197|nr:type II secretion system F family protein [Allobranchiibius sp. GilTou73]UIJ35098.1 type II secretion system F family protein [Allobranchiibius sp. GilTou73]
MSPSAPGAWWCAVLLVAVTPLVWPRALPASPPASSVPPPVVAEDVRAVAASLDLLALALGSGVPLVTAVEAVAEDAGELVSRHLRQVAAAMRWGVDEVRAWDGLPAVWKPAAASLALAVTAGVPPGALLRRAADDIRRGERQRLDEAIGRVSVLIVVPLGLCFLPAFALLTVVPVVMTIARSVLAGTS